MQRIAGLDPQRVAQRRSIGPGIGQMAGRDLAKAIAPPGIRSKATIGATPAAASAGVMVPMLCSTSPS
jgi:hypothetical protein